MLKAKKIPLAAQTVLSSKKDNCCLAAVGNLLKIRGYANR